MKAQEFLEFISEINQLDHHQRTVLAKALDQLEDEPKVYNLIETIFDSKGVCPHCSHTENFRHGIIDALQRYRCKACKKTFNALTGTPLAHLRLKSKWLDYLGALAESLTVRQAAKEINELKARFKDKLDVELKASFTPRHSKTHTTLPKPFPMEHPFA